jgi:hypothetical protein
VASLDGSRGGRVSKTRHYEKTVIVPAAPGELFEQLDDIRRLGNHMSEPSLMMMGGNMSYELDAAAGRAPGSVIRISGRVLGMRLFAEEVVTVHEAPRRKSWEARGPARLLVIGRYGMGYEIAAAGTGSRLRVFIDYVLPDTFVAGLAGLLFGDSYARWCVDRMVEDAQRHQASVSNSAAS